MSYIKVCQHVPYPWGHPSSLKGETLHSSCKKKKNVAAIFPSKLIIVGQWNTPHTDSVFWVTSEPTLTNREKKHCTLRLCNETVIGVLQPTWLEAVNYKHNHTLTHTLKVHLISWQRMGIVVFRQSWHYNSGIMQGASLFSGRMFHI